MSETTRTRYRLRGASARGLADRLVEILDQIVGILEAHTHPHEPFGNPARRSLRLRQGTVGHGGGVLDESFRPAEAYGQCRHLHRFYEPPARAMASLQLETQHRAEAGHLSAREGVLRERFKAGIVDRTHGPMIFQRLGERLGTRALGLHADRERLQPRRTKNPSNGPSAGPNI